MKNYIQSLKFALYCITHPFDGFWDLTHEKRGSIAAANTILILTLIVRIMKLQYTSFIILAKSQYIPVSGKHSVSTGIMVRG